VKQPNIFSYSVGQTYEQLQLECANQFKTKPAVITAPAGIKNREIRVKEPNNTRDVVFARITRAKRAELSDILNKNKIVGDTATNFSFAVGERTEHV